MTFHQEMKINSKPVAQNSGNTSLGSAMSKNPVAKTSTRPVFFLQVCGFCSVVYSNVSWNV